MVSLLNPVTVLSPDKFNLPSVPSRNPFGVTVQARRPVGAASQ